MEYTYKNYKPFNNIHNTHNQKESNKIRAPLLSHSIL